MIKEGQCISGRWAMVSLMLARKWGLALKLNPSQFLTWFRAIKTPAPVANPITTEWEMKVTRLPILAKLMATCIPPTIRDMARTMAILWDSGSVMAITPSMTATERAEKTSIEIALVGPEIRNLELPTSEETITGTIAA